MPWFSQGFPPTARKCYTGDLVRFPLGYLDRGPRGAAKGFWSGLLFYAATVQNQNIRKQRKRSENPCFLRLLRAIRVDGGRMVAGYPARRLWPGSAIWASSSLCTSTRRRSHRGSILVPAAISAKGRNKLDGDIRVSPRVVSLLSPFSPVPQMLFLFNGGRFALLRGEPFFWGRRGRCR